MQVAMNSLTTVLLQVACKICMKERKYIYYQPGLAGLRSTLLSIFRRLLIKGSLEMIVPVSESHLFNPFIAPCLALIMCIFKVEDQGDRTQKLHILVLLCHFG